MKLFLLSYILLSLTLFGQTPIEKIKTKKSATDTVDYEHINHVGGYSLLKVEDGNTKLIHGCSKDLKFFHVLDSTFWRNTPFVKGQSLKQTDTLIDMSWYLIRNAGCVSEVCRHIDYLWKMKVNLKSNVIVAERLFCEENKQLVKLYFKVLKFSDFEITLEDLQIKPLRRIYYFKAKEAAFNDKE